jgi:hypothetical protein
MQVSAPTHVQKRTFTPEPSYSRATLLLRTMQSAGCRKAVFRGGVSSGGSQDPRAEDPDGRSGWHWGGSSSWELGQGLALGWFFIMGIRTGAGIGMVLLQGN